MRYRLAFALGKLSHQLRHVGIVGSFTVGKATHRGNQVFVTLPCKPRPRQASLEILLMARPAYGDAARWRCRSIASLLCRPALGGEISCHLAKIFLCDAFGYG